VSARSRGVPKLLDGQLSEPSAAHNACAGSRRPFQVGPNEVRRDGPLAQPQSNTGFELKELGPERLARNGRVGPDSGTHLIQHALGASSGSRSREHSGDERLELSADR
jgi:hypothetical protein